MKCLSETLFASRNGSLLEPSINGDEVRRMREKGLGAAEARGRPCERVPGPVTINVCNWLFPTMA